MTDKVKNASNQPLQYRSPKVKVILVKAQGVLCGSLFGTPGTNPWNNGSDSSYGFGEED